MKSIRIDKTLLTPSTLVGLALPLIGMPLWNFVVGPILKPVMERNDLSFLGTLVTVAMAFGVVAIVLWWEKKPLSSMGLRRQTPRTIIFALSASIIIAVGSTLIGLFLINLFGLPMPPLLTDKIKGFPVWLGIWIVLSSSIAEEFLYRGYVIERLGQLTGNIWIGGLITLVWFTAMHLPFGLVYILTIVLPVTILITGLYIWRHDLIATIVTHLVMNAPIAAAAILFALVP
jgi:membrane protease YdiL (CAAX protease family)